MQVPYALISVGQDQQQQQQQQLGSWTDVSHHPHHYTHRIIDSMFVYTASDPTCMREHPPLECGSLPPLQQQQQQQQQQQWHHHHRHMLQSPSQQVRVPALLALLWGKRPGA